MHAFVSVSVGPRMPRQRYILHVLVRHPCVILLFAVRLSPLVGLTLDGGEANSTAFSHIRGPRDGECPNKFPHGGSHAATQKLRGSHTEATRDPHGNHAGEWLPRGSHAGATRELIWALSGTSTRKRSQNVAAAKQNNSLRLGYLLGTCGFLK